MICDLDKNDNSILTIKSKFLTITECHLQLGLIWRQQNLQTNSIKRKRFFPELIYRLNLKHPHFLTARGKEF